MLLLMLISTWNCSDEESTLFIKHILKGQFTQIGKRNIFWLSSEFLSMLRVKVTVHHNIISVVYPYRLFRCELKSLGDISCRHVCLVSNLEKQIALGLTCSKRLTDLIVSSLMWELFYFSISEQREACIYWWTRGSILQMQKSMASSSAPRALTFLSLVG